MAVNIATLAIKFVADTSGIKQGVSSVVSNVLTGAAAFIGINRAIAAFSSGAERIDKMSKVADRLGVSFKTIQGAALTGKLAGIELDTLTDAIDKMSKNIGSGGMSLDKRFLQQAEAIAAIKDPAQQAAKAMEIFGKSGAKLLPLLKQGGRAFKEASDLIERFDLGISDLDAKNVERMNDSWTKMGAIMSGTIDKIVAEMAPAMGAFLDHTIDQLAEVGMGWSGIGDIIALETQELANWMDLMRANVEGWKSLGHTISGVFAGGDRAMAQSEAKAGLESLRKGQEFLNRFWKGTAGMELRDAIDARKGGRGADKLGGFGGIETKFSPSADRGSQAAAKIINSAGGSAMSEADKAAVEMVRKQAAANQALEAIRRAVTDRPIILALGSM